MVFGSHLRVLPQHTDAVPSFSKCLPTLSSHCHVTSLSFYRFPKEATFGVKVKVRSDFDLLFQSGRSCVVAKWAVLPQGQRQGHACPGFDYKGVSQQ